MKVTALLFLILVSSTVFAGPSATDCIYYLQAEQEYKCGQHGYLMDFGFRLCQRYLKEQPNTRPNVQTWFPKVRYCLQDYIEKNRGTFRDCHDLKKRALDSHVGCYLETGFCDLRFEDDAQILQITSFDLFRPSIISLSLKVRSACHQ